MAIRSIPNIPNIPSIHLIRNIPSIRRCSVLRVRSLTKPRSPWSLPVWR